MHYEFSKNISQAVDHSSGFDSIYTYDHFLPYYAPNNKNDFFVRTQLSFLLHMQMLSRF
jgi:hypothetical protein